MTAPDREVNAEFAAFREKFLNHILDAYDIPEDLRELWRDLR